LGTEISLDIGGISIAWAKNNRGEDHGFLFQPGDRKRFPCAQIDYELEEDDDPDRAEMEMGFTRSLRAVLPRLELLGFTLPAAEAEYARDAAANLEQRKFDREVAGENDVTPLEVMPFKDFLAFLAGVNIIDLDATFVNGGGDEEKRIMGRFTDEVFKSRIPYYDDMYDRQFWSERSYFGSLIGFLHPYALLRLLAENPGNLDVQLEWQYGPLVFNGWVEESQFISGARRTQTYLIATEGSSDTHVLKRAFQLLRPEIADFFRFIDVSQRHPFSGTGSLVKFAEGLAKIDVHNRTVFLLDNDAEGSSAFHKIGNMLLPVNMRAMTLPALNEFIAFQTVGPEGETEADINGRAAAIECYLDLEADGLPPPVVRWTNFKEDVAVYQGALQHKDLYSKAFFDRAGHGGKPYETVKLDAVLGAIIGVCTSMATEMLERDEN